MFLIIIIIQHSLVVPICFFISDAFVVANWVHSILAVCWIKAVQQCNTRTVKFSLIHQCATGELETLGNVNQTISEEQIGNFEQWTVHDDQEDKFCDIDGRQRLLIMY